MASYVPHSPSLVLSSFPAGAKPRSCNLHRNHCYGTSLSSHKPFLRGSLCVARLGFKPDPETADGVFRELFSRTESLLYTIADAAVSSGTDAVTSSKSSSDWLSGITNYMETVLKVLKGGLSSVHVPYSYGFAIILLTLLVKAATFPLTKKQVESTMSMRSLQPQIKAIQERYAGDQERIQLETARLYKLAGINPLAGCLPTLATIPVWIGLYRALSNVADEGLLTEGFFWIPSLAGPTTVATRQNGSGISWLFPFVDGHPPLGWSDTFAYLVLPVLLVVSQYISVQIMQSSQGQIDDPNVKNSQAITKFLPLMIGYFSLSVPSGLSLYWLTNNILSTGQQVWLQKLGGAKVLVKQVSEDVIKENKAQTQKSFVEMNSTKEAREQENMTLQGPRPGERFKQLKEQETRRKRQKEEERKAEETVAKGSQLTNDGDKKEAYSEGETEAGPSLVGNRNETNPSGHTACDSCNNGAVNGSIYAQNSKDSHEMSSVSQPETSKDSENFEGDERDNHHSSETSGKEVNTSQSSTEGKFSSEDSHQTTSN